MGHFSVDTEATGARCLVDGEHDSCLVFHVVVGLPVWFSPRGYAHVVPLTGREGEPLLRRIEGLPGVARVTPGAPIAIESELWIPLRRDRRLAAAALLYGATFLAGVAAVAGGMIVAADGRAAPIAAKVALALFPVLLGLYLWQRAPSARDAGLRRALRERLGVAADPAGWAPDTARGLASQLGLPTSAADLRRAAEDPRAEDALLAARLALALLDASDDPRLLEEATDRGLDALARCAAPALQP